MSGYRTPNAKSLSGVTVPQKRTAIPDIVIPPSTRQCLHTAREGVQPLTLPAVITTRTANHGLQSKTLYSSEYCQEISAYDKIKRDKIQQVPNYVTNIYQRFYCVKVSCSDQAGLMPVNLLLLKKHHWTIFCIPYYKEDTRPLTYIDDQPEITTHDWSILMDWIIEVHM
jgi:hypothetical protein